MRGPAGVFGHNPARGRLHCSKNRVEAALFEHPVIWLVAERRVRSFSKGPRGNSAPASRVSAHDRLDTTSFLPGLKRRQDKSLGLSAGSG